RARPAGWRLAARQHGCDRCEEIASVKTRRDALRLPVYVPAARLSGTALDQLKQAVAGTDVPSAVGLDNNPGRSIRELVVGQHVSSGLRLGQVLEPDDRDFGAMIEFRRLVAAMAGYDLLVPVDQNRRVRRRNVAGSLSFRSWSSSPIRPIRASTAASKSGRSPAASRKPRVSPSSNALKNRADDPFPSPFAS